MPKYLITHAKREFGADPRHTQEGTAQLQKILIPEGIELIVCGTGKRFREILLFLFPNWILRGRPVVSSPFCGSADGLEADGRIILTDESLVKDENYMGLISGAKAEIFHPWDFIAYYPAVTLFLAGTELLTALGLGAIKKSAGLYEIDPWTKTGKLLN